MAALIKRHKLSIILGILFFCFLTYPFVQIFNRDVLVAGIPLLTLYLFSIWILAIVALFVLGRWFNLNR